MEKINIREKYNLPEEVRYCKKCTISNQRPRIKFDEHGVCSACNFSEFKRTFDWDKREQELADLCNRFRKKSGWDVIVPCSGGKDGSFTAHYLKHRHGMNPLTVTWAPHVYTEIGFQNLQSFIKSGFDNILGTPRGDVHRRMTRLAFEHVGDPFQPFIYGQTNFPLRVAVQNEISLLMYGENGEVEYGGDMKNAFRPTREITDHNKHYFSGLPPEFWTQFGVSERDIEPYMAPEFKKIQDLGVEIHFLGYYKFWDPQENFYYCVENTGFQPNPERSEGTYSKYASLDDRIDGFHYYMAHVKFGIGRTTSDTAHEIRDNKITREEGIALVRKFDGEFPRKNYQLFLDYCGIDEKTFEDIVEKWRGEHVWERRGHNGEWALKNPIWEDAARG